MQRGRQCPTIRRSRSSSAAAARPRTSRSATARTARSVSRAPRRRERSLTPVRSEVRRGPEVPIGAPPPTTDSPASTWAMNVLVPGIAAERYAHSRIVAFSTGNVYPLTSVHGGGSRETDPLGPVGEYASSCVGRERILEYYSVRNGTPVAIV